MNQELKDKRINDLIALFTKGQIEQCISQGKKVLKMYPNEPFLFNILGITHAAKGLFTESLNYYEKAIDLNPSYFEVFNNMGVAYNDWKKPKEAIPCLKKAIGIQPSYAEAFNNIGNSYKELSDFDNAVISYKKAIDLAPTYTDALCNLGICWSLQEKYEQAEAAYKKALDIDPGNIKTSLLLANSYIKNRDFRSGLSIVNKIISENPSNFEALYIAGLCYRGLGQNDKASHYFINSIRINPDYSNALNSLGFLRLHQKRFTEAIKVFERVLKLDTKQLDAYTNLGKAFIDNGNIAKAEFILKQGLNIDCCHIPIVRNLFDVYMLKNDLPQAEKFVRTILAHQPNLPEALNALGSIYEKKGEFEEAEKLIMKALENDKKLVKAKINLATIYQHQKKNEGAIEIYADLIKDGYLDPNIFFNSANVFLVEGDYKEGWKSYEYRWKVDPLNKAEWPIAGRQLWEGERDSDIVLWREQGIGDELIFLGLVPEARELSKSVFVYIDKRLIPLCERSMPDVRFLPDPEQIAEREFDYHLPMGSLPRLFRSSEEDFEKTVKSYLKADADRVEVLRQELNIGDKKIIGISWKSIKSLNHLKKSLTLMEFGKIFQDLEVVLLNLQYGEVDEEIQAFERDTGIEIIQCSSVDNREDLDGLAALIELCDLVVSTSNVTIHLAGALGKDTWVLLPYVANFWWLLERTDSVWYPSLTLYRQKKLKDWDGVALNLKEDLKKKFTM